jgi:hypothetical protein
MKYTMIAFLLLISGVSFSQAIARQSINSLGGSHQIQGVRIDQSVGQPHSTTTEKTENIIVQQGFIQPRTFFVEPLNDATINILIFPNPTTEQFSIRTEENIASASIQIVDLTGKIVKEINLTEFRNHTIDCTTWGNGTYIVSFVTNDGRKNNSKLIISK